MTDEPTDQRLETILRSVGHHLEIPPQPPDLEFTAPEGDRKRTRRLLAAAAAVVLVVGGLLLVPSSRAAIAGLLGIGSTRIEITGETSSAEHELPHIAQGLTAISIDDATAIVDGGLPDTGATALGPPEAVYQMPEGGVLFAWQADAATLWVRNADGAEGVFRKLVSSGEDVEAVSDLGTEALLISDTHIFQTPQRRLSARTVLLWHDEDHEYRFEANLTPADLVELAREFARS